MAVAALMRNFSDILRYISPAARALERAISVAINNTEAAKFFIANFLELPDVIAYENAAESA